MTVHSPITIARFWSKVSVGDNADCWPWLAKRNEKGYGCFQDFKSHRVAYEFLRGPIPDGKIACHHCDNPSCCNPHHIFLGTHQDNADDCVIKGRSRKGERHPMSKLTDDQVDYIRSSPKTGASLALELGVSKSTISGIRTYTHRKG
jgi:hypothetical protein